MNYKRYFIPNSMVFITIVTYNRKDFLLDYIDLIKRSLKYTKTKISFKIDAIVILKDHIHFILQPENINDYPNIIKYFKTFFSRNINIDNSDLTEGKKYKCLLCGYIYDDGKETVKFEDLPDDWKCPLCGADKSMFEEIK